MVPPEIIEYTPYSVAFAMLWIAATLTMTAKFLPSGALHHPLVILQHGCDSLGRFATAMAIHNNLETLEQTPCSMDIRVPPLTTAISTAMAKLRPSQCTRTPHLRCCDKGPPCRFVPEGSDNRVVPNRTTCCTTLLHSAPLRSVPIHSVPPSIPHCDNCGIRQQVDDDGIYWPLIVHCDICQQQYCEMCYDDDFHLLRCKPEVEGTRACVAEPPTFQQSTAFHGSTATCDYVPQAMLAMSAMQAALVVAASELSALFLDADVTITPAFQQFSAFHGSTATCEYVGPTIASYDMLVRPATTSTPAFLVCIATALSFVAIALFFVYQFGDRDEPRAKQRGYNRDDGECIFKITADSITADTGCLTCGGRGHVSRLDGQSCLTAMHAALVAVACLAGDLLLWLAPRHALNAICATAHKANFVFLSAFVLMVCPTPVEGVNPNLQTGYTILPGMEIWNGVPYHDFRRVWFATLIVALGSIFQEGWTLIQVARDEDLGGPSNPGTASQNTASNNRNMRLFHSILNYIDTSCDLYRRVWSTFNNDGRGLYNYLWIFGHLPYTLREINTLEATWKDASVLNLRIVHDEETVFKWKSWCMTEGDKRNKNLIEIRNKFLEGLPDYFNIVVIRERNSTANGGAGRFVHPAHDPAHYPTTLAGTPHPNAGEPDMDALATNFNIEWVKYFFPLTV